MARFRGGGVSWAGSERPEWDVEVQRKDQECWKQVCQNITSCCVFMLSSLLWCVSSNTPWPTPSSLQSRHPPCPHCRHHLQTVWGWNQNDHWWFWTVRLQLLRPHAGVCVCVSSSYWSLFKLCGQCCDCVFCPAVQINRHYHAVKGGAFSTEHLDQGTTFLIQLIKTMKRTNPDWTKEQQLKGKNTPPWGVLRTLLFLLLWSHDPPGHQNSSNYRNLSPLPFKYLFTFKIMLIIIILVMLKVMVSCQYYCCCILFGIIYLIA